MTDAEKQALAPSQRACVIKEGFAEHEARTGEKLTILVWEEEQAAIKARKDAERDVVLKSQADLVASIAAKTKAVASATGDSKRALKRELDELQQQQKALVIPEAYEIKPMPPRLRAALGQ